MDHSVDKNSRCDHCFWIDLTCLHNVFGLDNGDLSCRAHDGTEITSRFVVNQIAIAISSLTFYQTKVSFDAIFKNVCLPVEFPGFFTFCQGCVD